MDFLKASLETPRHEANGWVEKEPWELPLNNCWNIFEGCESHFVQSSSKWLSLDKID